MINTTVIKIASSCEPGHLCLYTTLEGPSPHKIQFQSPIVQAPDEFQGPIDNFMVTALDNSMKQHKLYLHKCEVETLLHSLPDLHLALHGLIYCEFDKNHRVAFITMTERILVTL